MVSGSPMSMTGVSAVIGMPARQMASASSASLPHSMARPPRSGQCQNEPVGSQSRARAVAR
jgi:hypothetical protein